MRTLKRTSLALEALVPRSMELCLQFDYVSRRSR